MLIERPDQPLVATRQLLRKLLRTRLTFSPDPERPGVVRFRGEGTLTPIIGMLAIQGLQGGVAPTVGSRTGAVPRRLPLAVSAVSSFVPV